MIAGIRTFHGLADDDLKKLAKTSGYHYRILKHLSDIERANILDVEKRLSLHVKRLFRW